MSLKLVRLLPLVVAAVLELAMLNNVMHGKIWPPKAALLVGSRLVGQLSRARDPQIPVLADAGYDSQFYWAIAQDPFMRDSRVLKSLDATAYRYQRILFPLIAWLTPGSVPSLAYRLWALAGAAWLAGLYAMYRLARGIPASAPAAMMLYAVSPGLAFAVLHPLPDVWATTLSLLGLLAWTRRRHGWAAVLFALAGLAKETTVLVPAALILPSLGRRQLGSTRNLLLCAAIVPAAAWQIILRLRLGVWPMDQSVNNLALPFAGLLKVGFDVLLTERGVIDFLVAVEIATLAVYTLTRIGWPGSDLEAVLWGQACLMLVAGSAVMEGIGSSSRASILFFLFFGLWVLQRGRPSPAAAVCMSGLLA